MGKRSKKKCMGVIQCDNPGCKILVRPMTTEPLIGKQLLEECECGAHLSLTGCVAFSERWTWNDGAVHYRHTGYHNHQRPPKLHATPEEKAQFIDLVNQHPDSGPLQLIVGVPGLNGPGESVADISDIYINSDRVSKERQKLKHGGSLSGSGGGASLEYFALFEEQHPDFVKSATIGIVTVLSMQSPFMRSQLIKNDVLDGPINGLLSDAAHGWWANRKWLLVMTSVYCPDTRCWVPGLMSYSNGATGTHYMHHFLTLIHTIAYEASNRGIEVNDLLFVGVCHSNFLYRFNS